MPTDKHTTAKQDAIRETVYVWMRETGDFLCASPGRFYSFMWSSQIAKALRGDDPEQAEQRAARLVDKIEDRKVRRMKPEADLYRADIIIASAACAPYLAEQAVRTDFVRMTGICGATLTYQGFSPVRSATRPSKALGFSALSLAGDSGMQRIIQLNWVKAWDCG